MTPRRSLTVFSTLWPALVVSWVGVSLLQPLRTNDIWWHLETGRRILAEHVVPKVDPYSLTCRGRPWVDFEWAYQVVLYSLYHLGGLYGIFALKFILIAGILTFFWLRLKQTRLSAGWRWAIVAFFFQACRPGWTDRADLVSLLFLAALLNRLDARQKDEAVSTGLWLWAGLFALWANFHAGFIIGLGILALFIAQAWMRRDRASRSLAVWGIACLLATLVNPNGWGLHRFILRILPLAPAAGQTEFQPPPWIHMAWFWLAIAVGYMIVWRNRRAKLGWVTWVLCGGTTLAAMSQSRHAPLALLVLLPLCGRLLVEDSCYQRVHNFFAIHSIMSDCLATTVLVALCIGSLHSISFGLATHEFPIAVCEYISRHHPATRYFNEYDFGSYWIWRFKGEPAVFMDGRSPSVDGYYLLNEEIKKARGGTPVDWNAFLDRYHLDGALIQYPISGPGSSVLAAYFPKPQWALVYWDDLSVLFVRRAPKLRNWLRREEFSCVQPDLSPAVFARDLQEHPDRRACARNEIERSLIQHPHSARIQNFSRAIDEIQLTPAIVVPQ